MKLRYKISMIFVLATILTGLSTAFAGGDGSSSSPYQISTCQQLQDMQNDLSANYTLVNDVDCSGFDYSSVGDDANQFTGVLDGQGYVVENLTIDEGGSNYVGLIGYLGSGGEVRDIGVVNADITGSGSDKVGGLMGINYGSVSSSFSTGSVSGDHEVGGLVGWQYGSLSNSFSTASVSASGNYVGGLVGKNSDNVSSSFSTGSVSGQNAVGGLVGKNYVAVSSSYWDTESSGQSSSDGGTGLTTSEMQGDSAAVNMELDFSEKWNTTFSYPKLQWMENGDGSSGDPYRIYHCPDLQAMQNNLSANYVLGNDVNCSETKNWNGDAGFNPVGPFDGALDGKGHDVSGLFIDRPSTENVGMFGTTEQGSYLKNIGIIDANVTGGGKVGVLVGNSDYGSGGIEDTHTSGYLENQGGAWGNAGGLVGAQYEGVISDSYSRVEVNNPTTGNDIGGLVGTSHDSIIRSFSTGPVTSDGWHTGGLAGSVSGENKVIRNSYSTSDVEGDDFVGGIAGAGSNAGHQEFKGTFHAGNINGFESVGGIIPSDENTNGSKILSSNYWNQEVSGISGSAGGTGLTTSEMQGSTPFCEGSMFGLDFSSTWFTWSGDYPGLRGFYSSPSNLNCPPSASFTSNSPVLTSEDFGLDASGSSDPNGDSLTYEWDTNNDGSYGDATGVTPSVSKSDNGSYSIGLKVSDGNGGSDTVSQTVQVNNRVPVASFSFSPSAPSVSDSVSFDGSLSSDSDGSIQLFEWDWNGDGTFESTGESVSNSFGSSGDKVVELRVKDDDGAYNSTVETVSVSSISLSVDWSGYSSSSVVDGFRVYYGIDGIDESNMVEVGSSTDSKEISDAGWATGDNVCVEVRPYNDAGEANSEQQCINIS